MRRIDLQEHKRSNDPVRLTTDERQQLRQVPLSLSFDPADSESEYYLTPGSTVGAIEIADLSVLIEPKIGIPQLLSMACYALGVVDYQALGMFDFKRDEALPDMLACALAAQAHQAIRRGLLHGYRTEEETLYGIRGRIRFDDQLRRRYAIPMPIEVRYDEFTNDILANQLIKAAAEQLGRLELRSQQARRGLAWIGGMLADVSWVDFQATRVPEIAFDRLNEHYRLVVELSRLILRHSQYQAGRGKARASGFLVNMDVLFEEFTTRALREALEVSDRTFRKVRTKDRMTLDEQDQVGLKPDLSWWDGNKCRFVGDVKYKRSFHQRVPNADLYQLLAYTTALDLPGGMLIYAHGEAEPAVHQVRHLGKRLEIAALDLSGTLDHTLAQIKKLAERIKKWRDKARTIRPAA